MLLVNPLAGEVTSGYDLTRRHPSLKNADGSPKVVPHYGTDIGGRPRGITHPINAACAGRVRYVRTDSWAGDLRGGYLDRLTGRQVVLEHAPINGRTFLTYYGHLDRVTVREGQTVQAGDQIGTQGATGGASGAHLHLEVWLGGNPVDPAPFFASRGVLLGTGPTSRKEAVMAKLDKDDYSEIARHVWEFYPKGEKRSAWTLLREAWDKSVKTNTAAGRTERFLSGLAGAAGAVYGKAKR